MKLIFSGLGAPELKRRLEPDVLVNVEADLVVMDGEQVLYADVAFPVLELSVALREWKSVPGGSRAAFEFPSLSMEDRWSVRILPVDSGWQVIDDEGGNPVAGSLRTTEEIDSAIDEFTDKLRAECVALLGSWIEEYFV
jgi:hypothetical protein